MTDQNLTSLREEIDAVDTAILHQLQRRFAIVNRVIAIKRQENVPAIVPERIEEVVRNVKSRATEINLPSNTVEKLWRLLIAETIAYEEKVLRAE